MSADQVRAAEPSDTSDAASSMDSAARARALDAKYGYKGWITSFPSYGNTLTNDDGHWRTKLAEHGFGFQIQGVSIAQANLLNTPSKIPSEGYASCGPSNNGYNCAGGRSYFGQRPGIKFAGTAFLTYDMSQYGVPDGQIAVATNFGVSSDQQYSANTARINGISWFQTIFDKKVELKAGYFPTMPEFAGTTVGGLVVNPFGPSASMPVIFGTTSNNIATPNFRATWRVTDKFYAQTGIQRSTPVRGPTGNTLYDEIKLNPSGLDFNSSVPGTGVLYTNELGYKRPSKPGIPFAWLRAGVMHNTSEFKDYSRLLETSTATKNGATGLYILGDYQLTQPLASQGSAHRGMYIGGSFMYGDPKVASSTQYYEARSYWFGPFENRPSDFLSVVALHNKTSKYAQNVINSFSSRTNFFANKASNSITASYTYYVRSGLYATFGAGYSDNPSFQYFKNEGHSLNALFSLYAVF
ncbi:carbohydrate porin [Xylophilus sp. GW821-FHT01B05]